MQGKEKVVAYVKQRFGNDLHMRVMKLSSQFTDDSGHNLELFRQYGLFNSIVVSISREFTENSEFSDIPPAVVRTLSGVLQEFVSNMIENVRAHSERIGADAFAEEVADVTGKDLKIYDIKAGMAL